MAIRSKYEFSGIEHENSYYRIQKISLAISDKEVEIDYDDKTVVDFKVEIEAIAFAMVYADEDSRKKNIRPINRIAFQFKYNFNDGNIMQRAYEALYADLSSKQKAENV
jgi:hypothetical protein